MALPLTAIGEGASRAAGLPPARRELASRFVVSFFNAVITALLLAAFYVAARRLRIGAGAALAATALLGFTTPTWVYAKSFMAEPLEALGLLLALTGAVRARAGEPRAARTAGLGALIAIAVKLPCSRPTACLLPPCASAAESPPAGGPWAIVAGGLFHFARQPRVSAPARDRIRRAAPLRLCIRRRSVGCHGLLFSSEGLAVRAGRPRRSACASGAAPTRWPRATRGVAILLYAPFEHRGRDGLLAAPPCRSCRSLFLAARAWARRARGASRGGAGDCGLVVAIGGSRSISAHR